MVDFRVTAFAENSYDIKTGRRVSEIIKTQVDKSSPADLPLLLPGNRFGRITETTAPPGFNFNKNQRVTVAGDDIDLSGLAPEIPGQDPVVFSRQVSDGSFLTGPSQINPFARQTLSLP